MTITRTALAACIVLLFALSMGAQEEQSPIWTQAIVVDVKPEMAEEFENVLEQHWLPALKKSDTPWMSSWRGTGPGNPYQYVFVSPVKNFAQLDGAPPLLQTMGETEYAALFRRLERCVNSVEVSVDMYMPDLSIDKLEGQAPKLAIVNTVHVKPGKNEAYHQAVKSKFMPAMEKLGYQAVWTYSSVFGSPSNTWTHVVVLEGFADIDKGPPLQRAYGEEEGKKILTEFDGMITGDSLIFARHLPNLSHAAE